MRAHSLLLHFPNASTESAYATLRSKGAFTGVDKNLVYLVLTLKLIYAVSQLARGHLLDPWLLLEGSLIDITQLLLIWLEVWQKRRTPLAAGFRLVRTLLFCRRAKDWVGDVGTSPRDLVKAVVLQSGALFHAWNAFGTPLLFQHHIFVQTLAVFFSLTQICNRQCTTILEADGEVLQWWTDFNNIVVVLSGGLTHHDFSCTPSPITLCTQLIVLSLLVLGFLLPSMVIYNIELVSRTAYIEDQREGVSSWRSSYEGLPSWPQAIIFMSVGVSGFWSLAVYTTSLTQGTKGVG